MANKNTKRIRESWRTNPDSIQTYRRKTGININSTAARAKSGKKPYRAPTV